MGLTSASGVYRQRGRICLFRMVICDFRVEYREGDPDTSSGDVESMLGVLKAYWAATADTFKDAWNLPPARSRLVHGAGIVSMGFIMDAIGDRYHDEPRLSREYCYTDLQPLTRVCRWTSAYCDFRPHSHRHLNE